MDDFFQKLLFLHVWQFFLNVGIEVSVVLDACLRHIVVILLPLLENWPLDILLFLDHFDVAWIVVYIYHTHVTAVHY